MTRFGEIEPTPEVQAEVRRLCEAWQDSQVFMQLHGLVQANLFSATLACANVAPGTDTPRILRQEAADVRCVADGFAQFLEHLAERVEAGSN